MVMTLLLVMLGVVGETEEAEAPVSTGFPLMYEGIGPGVFCAGGTKGNLRELSPDGFETMREDIL